MFPHKNCSKVARPATNIQHAKCNQSIASTILARAGMSNTMHTRAGRLELYSAAEIIELACAKLMSEPHCKVPALATKQAYTISAGTII